MALTDGRLVHGWFGMGSFVFFCNFLYFVFSEKSFVFSLTKLVVISPGEMVLSIFAKEEVHQYSEGVSTKSAERRMMSGVSGSYFRNREIFPNPLKREIWKPRNKVNKMNCSFYLPCSCVSIFPFLKGSGKSHQDS